MKDDDRKDMTAAAAVTKTAAAAVPATNDDVAPPGIMTRIYNSDRGRSLIASGAMTASVIGGVEILLHPITALTSAGLALLAGTTGASALELRRRHADWIDARYGPGIEDHVKLAVAIRTTMAMKIARDPDLRAQSEKTQDLLCRAARTDHLGEFMQRGGVPEGKGEDFMRSMQDRVAKALITLERFPADKRIGISRMNKVLRAIMTPYTALLHAKHYPEATGFRKDPAPKQMGYDQIRALATSSAYNEALIKATSSVTGTSPARNPKAEPPSAWRTMADDLRANSKEAAKTVDEIEALVPRIREMATEYLTDTRRNEVRTLLDVHLPDMATIYVKALRIASDDPATVRRRGHEGLLPVLEMLRETRDEGVRRATGELDTRARFMETRHPVAPDDLKPIA